MEPPPAEAPHIIGDSHPQTRQTTAVRGRDSADNHAYATPATAFGLANSGDGDVAACASCHGVAEALEGEYPALRGQAAAYQVSQLQLFAKSGRGDVVDVNPMYAISHELTDRQMQAVAAWYAVQTPGNYDLEEEYGTSGAR